MIKVVVTCDRCHREFSRAGATEDVARWARERGWYSVGWVAYCPDCREVALPGVRVCDLVPEVR